MDWRRAWPYGVVLAFALVATGRPMFKYGFDWVSYCNDDMANYALAADWFYHHGYYDLPPRRRDHRGPALRRRLLVPLPRHEVPARV